MPDFKPLFGYDEPVTAPETEEQPNEAEKEPDAVSSWFEPNTPEPAEDRTSSLGFDPANVPVESADLLQEDEEKGPNDLEERLKKMEAELSLATEQREQSLSEVEILRQKADGEEGESGTVSSKELETASRERDEARMEVIVLRHQLESAEQTQRDTEAMASQLEELSHVIDERDSVRRDYATLREQFETLKLDRSRGDSTEASEALEEQVRQLREELDKRGPESANAGPSNNPDLASLQQELKKARDEASMSARGLALSQKALQETREALKEASEGPASSKGNLEDLKKERATLVRQNMLLQGQNDQLARELSAAKAKLAAKGE